VAPVTLDLVLGGRTEEALRQSMIAIVGAFLVLTMLSLLGRRLMRQVRFHGRPIEVEKAA